MTQQIEHFPLHQNAKVFAILTALGSLVFFVPFFVLGSLFSPAHAGPPLWTVVLMPVIYLVFGYLTVAVGCWLYNVMYPYIGGIEFTSRGSGTASSGGAAAN